MTLADPRYVEPKGEARPSEPFQQTRTVLRLCESSVRVSALAPLTYPALTCMPRLSVGLCCLAPPLPAPQSAKPKGYGCKSYAW